MCGYIVDDGEKKYTINLNIPRTKQKILRRHKKVIKEIKKVWEGIRETMKMFINVGLDTDDIMFHYVRLFINQSRIKG
jgi:hypothetical protein